MFMDTLEIRAIINAFNRIGAALESISNEMKISNELNKPLDKTQQENN